MDTYGSISSPGYPGNYPVNRDCFWTISTSPGLLITFAFGTLSLGHHENCSYDHLEVKFNCGLWQHFMAVLLQNKIFQNISYIQKGTVWILNPGLKCSFVLAYSSHRCPLRYRQYNRKRTVFHSTAVRGSLATKDGGIQAKYLVGGGKLLLSYKVQSPNSLSQVNPRRINQPRENC